MESPFVGHSKTVILCFVFQPDLLNFKKGWMSILDEPGEVSLFPYPLLLETCSEPAGFLPPCLLRCLLLGKAVGNFWWRCLALSVDTEVYRVPLSQLRVTGGI